MNKIQYIKLLNLRGVTELEKGTSIGGAVRETGGEPTESEMVKVNEQSMLYYIDEYLGQKQINEALTKENNSLKHDSKKLRALEGAGVDNWEGYDIAMEMMDDEC